MNICVVCTSDAKIDDACAELATDLGLSIGRRGHGLIFGGENHGLMSILADAAFSTGAAVIGVITRHQYERGLAYRHADRIIVAEDQTEQRAMMAKRAHGFAALPAGTGVLDDLVEILAVKKLKLVRGHAVLLDIDGFWDDDLHRLPALYDQRIAQPEYRDIFAVATSAPEALDLVQRRDGR